MVSRTKQPKRKIKIKKILIFLVFIIILIYLIISFLLIRIKNIYVSGNIMLSEQEVIDISKISDYPNTFLNLSPIIEARLEKNVKIKSAKVYKKWLNQVYIEIEENYSLFYNDSSKKTILLDGKEIDEKTNSSILINFVPDTLYEKFITKMSEIDKNILLKISEIKYDKNEVDETRFLFTMTDGNYVYLSLNTFEKLNNYIDIIKNFSDVNGILYLDSGEYFEIFEN